MPATSEHDAANAAAVSPAASALAANLEAVLLAAGRAVTAQDAWDALSIDEGAEAFAAGRPPAEALDELVAALNAELDVQGRAARVEKLAGGYRLMVAAGHARVVAAFDRARQPQRLSRPSIETLSIIAYRQPITRAQIEAIRGVACGEVLRSLLDRKLIAIKGRAEELGRPMLYGTTRQFLDLFGLASLKELPTKSAGGSAGPSAGLSPSHATPEDA
ncbi:MAG: SMC-Scp complex subunit ScpB [Planctomycetota bacterium]